MKIYDYAILGAGVEGIIVSSYLAKLGKSVCLIESAPKIGGNFRSGALEVFKNDTTTTNALSFLANEINLNFNFENVFSEPMTFDKSFQPFVGFGDEAPPYHDWLSAYASPEQLVCKPALNENLQTLITAYPVEVLTNSTITHLEISEGRAVELVLNGKTAITATHYISTLHPLKMGKWNKDLLTPKFILKMNKSSPWTTLAFDLTHPEIPNTTRGWYLLKGTKADWFAGRFTETGSQWLAFDSAEGAANAEFTANLFKDAKRSLAKAFPNLLNSITFEKLTVFPESHGQIHFKMNQENPFPSVKNLWICTGMATDSMNPVVAGILAAQELLMDLQIHGYIENTAHINSLEPAQENPATL